MTTPDADDDQPLVVDAHARDPGGAGDENGEDVGHAPESSPSEAFDDGETDGVGADDLGDLHAPYPDDDEPVHEGADGGASRVCRALWRAR